MPSTIFKFSAIALGLAGISTASHAALYTITPLSNPASGQSHSSKATAISENGIAALESLSGPQGDDYSNEVPYLIDTRHYLNRWNELESYCVNYLGYYTCSSWADVQWFGLKPSNEICNSEDSPQLCTGGIKRSIDAWGNNYTSNNTAFVNSTRVNPFGGGVTGSAPPGIPQSNSTDVVVSAVNPDGTSIGTSSSPYYANNGVFARAFVRRGFINSTTELKPPAVTPLIESIGQTIAKGAIDISIASGIPNSIMTFGSASIANMADAGNPNKSPEGSGLSGLSSCGSVVNYADRACQYFQFANQAAVWISSYGNNTTARAIDSFPDGPTGNGDETSQASINGAANIGGDTSPPTLVGFMTFNDGGNFYPTAIKYSPLPANEFANCINELQTNDSQRCWTRSQIPGLNIRQDGNILYSHTIAYDINNKGVTVGVAKSSHEINGAFSETIFINEGEATTQLGPSHSELFFRGYNATAAAINDNNELIGKVDIERSRDKARRQRGYIYLHGDAPNLARFQNKRAWLLDDLTNDDDATGTANQYRIAEAFDISNAGEIAASAFYCPGGYSSTAHNALCDGTEQLIAVKLSPNNVGNISPRMEKRTLIQRSGGSVGGLSLILLALIGGFRRKK